MHNESHPLAGQKVTLNDSVSDNARGIVVSGAIFVVEDWWDKLTGKSWGDSEGNPAALQYALRQAFTGNPHLDDEVVYGKIDGLGHLVHVSELGD